MDGYVIGFFFASIMIFLSSFISILVLSYRQPKPIKQPKAEQVQLTPVPNPA